MKSAQETKALHRRVSLANKHWGLFFSNMPTRIINLPGLMHSSGVVEVPIKNVAANDCILLSDAEISE
jgi:hypothetical protein